MAADECNIRVVARFRPLNESEERAGSKSVVKFPPDQEETVLISVRLDVFSLSDSSSFVFFPSFRAKFMSLIKFFALMPHKRKFIMKRRKKLSKMFSVDTMGPSLPMDKHRVERLIPWKE